MQLQLPIFTIGTKFISSCVGVYEQDSLVQYIVNGLPVYAHGKDDLQALRFFFSNLISYGICTNAEVRKCIFLSCGPGIPAMRTHL